MATTAISRKANVLTRPVGDSLLMKRIRAGEEEAFTELYNTHYDRVLAAVKRFVKNDESEHIANGVFAKVWQVRNSEAAGYKGNSSIATWLTKIAYNEALMHIRRSQPERNHLAYSLDDVVEMDNGSEMRGEFASKDLELESLLECREIHRALARLPHTYRVIFKLRVIDDLSLEETCKVLNLNLTVVKGRLFRGRQMMREMLAQKKVSKEVAESATSAV